MSSPTLSAIERRLSELWQLFGVSQLLDILLVSIFVYSVIVWFQSARTRFVALGVAVLTGLYGLAMLLDLYLTLWLFQVGLTVALVALVVIFQDDIRRAFERLAARFASGSSAPSDKSGVVDTLVVACEMMAKERTGALIVLPGKDLLARHLTGGVPLDGKLSLPLLLSVFDHHSPGHDGAILIENGKLTRFAAHLPLSHNVEGGERFGTRHTAALGLSERSDALTIVVSEERGTITVAERGQLRVLDSAAELASVMEKHYARVSPRGTQSRLAGLLVSRPWTKLASVVIAIGTWVIVFGVQGETLARTYKVPIEYRDVPDGWIIDEPDPLEASITLSGSLRAFRVLDPDSLVISVDVGHLRPGRQSVSVSEDDLVRPADLIVHKIEPSHVTLVAHETERVTVAIKAKTIGKVPGPAKLGKIALSPDKLELLVRKRDASRLKSVSTEPIDLEVVPSTRSINVGVELPPGARLARNAPREVTAQVEIISPEK